MARKEFDPLAYIENAFLDKKRDARVPVNPGTLSIDVPTLGEYLGGDEPAIAHQRAGRTIPKTKFRKRELSAPRPRRAKDPTADPLEQDLRETWEHLPRNIEFLSSFFDDSVTKHYYRGDFKESRHDLFKRLMDPELTLEEVSRLLGVCPATVRRYTNRGWMEHFRTKGGQRRFRLSGVVKFVDIHGRTPEE